jgi:hypothetical protein
MFRVTGDQLPGERNRRIIIEYFKNSLNCRGARVVGSVGGLGDAQRPLQQGLRLVGLAQIAQRQGEIVQVVETAGWSGP